MNVPLLRQVITEMERCQAFNLSGSWTRWIGMLQQAGEGAQTVSKFRIYPCGCAGQGDQEWPCDQHRKPSTPLAASSARAGQPTEDEKAAPKAWLIYDNRSECYWGPNRGGYWKSIASAGLYTEAEAKAEEDFARRYGRQEIAVPLSKFGVEIKRLAAALSEAEAADILLGQRLASVPAVAAPSVGAAPQQEWTEAQIGEAVAAMYGDGTIDLRLCDWIAKVLHQHPAVGAAGRAQEDDGTRKLIAAVEALQTYGIDLQGAEFGGLVERTKVLELLRGAALDAPEQP